MGQSAQWYPNRLSHMQSLSVQGASCSWAAWRNLWRSTSLRSTLSREWTPATFTCHPKRASLPLVHQYWCSEVTVFVQVLSVCVCLGVDWCLSQYFQCYGKYGRALFLSNADVLKKLICQEQMLFKWAVRLQNNTRLMQTQKVHSLLTIHCIINL